MNHSKDGIGSVLKPVSTMDEVGQGEIKSPHVLGAADPELLGTGWHMSKLLQGCPGAQKAGQHGPCGELPPFLHLLAKQRIPHVHRDLRWYKEQ